MSKRQLGKSNREWSSIRYRSEKKKKSYIKETQT